MPWTKSSGAGTQRDKESIIVYLTQAKGQPTPALPYELKGHIHPDEWSVRLAAITSLTSKFYQPLLERIWVMLAVISIIVVPAAIYPFLLRSYNLVDNDDDDGDDDDINFNSSDFFKVRIISFGIFFGTFLLFFVPIFVWKFVGKRAMQAMLSSWARADQRLQGVGAFIPVWNVSSPGVFSSQTIVKISLPSGTRAQHSNFHPHAYLPPYLLNSPPQPQGEGGLPGYHGSDFDMKYYDGDAKHFEDIKV